MEIKTFNLRNEEVLQATSMFFNNTNKEGIYQLSYTKVIANNDCDNSIMPFIEQTEKTKIPYKLLKQIELFYITHYEDYDIYILHTTNEVCGLIAFKDWKI